MTSSIALLFVGCISTLAGLIFLFGCFHRLDSPDTLRRTEGDEVKLAKLTSLQEAWDAIGKWRRFIASASAFLIAGIASLSIWYEPGLSKYAFVVPVLLGLNLIALLMIRKHAMSVMNLESHGGAQVMGVIKGNIRACITSSIIVVTLATMIQP